MTRTADALMAEPLLSLLATQGEMKVQEFLLHGSRKRGDYRDFYPVAALIHAGYIGTDAGYMGMYRHFGLNEPKDPKLLGKLGLTTQETAAQLCSSILAAGESFEFQGREWKAAPLPVRMFMTAEGYLRLAELERRRAERKRKRIDYVVSLSIAVLVALLSSYLAHYSATKRVQVERAQQSAVSGSPSPTR